MRREPEFAASGYEVNRRVGVFNLMIATSTIRLPIPKTNTISVSLPAKHRPPEKPGRTS